MGEVDREKVVPGFCDGCARIEGEYCEILTEPSYFLKKGGCFAKMDIDKAMEIEIEIMKKKKETSL